MTKILSDASDASWDSNACESCLHPGSATTSETAHTPVCVAGFGNTVLCVGYSHLPQGAAGIKPRHDAVISYNKI